MSKSITGEVEILVEVEGENDIKLFYKSIKYKNATKKLQISLNALCRTVEI